MKDFYIKKILEKKRRNNELYEKVLKKVLGEDISLNPNYLLELENDKLISIMVKLDKEVKIKESPYDIKKLARAIQNSRSGAGGCAMTEFECAFCGEKEVWSNTATPNICRGCAEKMATTFILGKFDIEKE